MKTFPVSSFSLILLSALFVAVELRPQDGNGGGSVYAYAYSWQTVPHSISETSSGLASGAAANSGAHTFPDPSDVNQHQQPAIIYPIQSIDIENRVDRMPEMENMEYRNRGSYDDQHYQDTMMMMPRPYREQGMSWPDTRRPMRERFVPGPSRERFMNRRPIYRPSHSDDNQYVPRTSRPPLRGSLQRGAPVVEAMDDYDMIRYNYQPQPIFVADEMRRVVPQSQPYSYVPIRVVHNIMPYASAPLDIRPGREMSNHNTHFTQMMRQAEQNYQTNPLAKSNVLYAGAFSGAHHTIAAPQPVASYRQDHDGRGSTADVGGGSSKNLMSGAFSYIS